MPPRILPSIAKTDVARSLRSLRGADSLRSDGPTAPYPFWTTLALESRGTLRRRRLATSFRCSVLQICYSHARD